MLASLGDLPGGRPSRMPSKNPAQNRGRAIVETDGTAPQLLPPPDAERISDNQSDITPKKRWKKSSEIAATVLGNFHGYAFVLGVLATFNAI